MSGTDTVVDEVVSTVGLWWPAADEVALRVAAAAWRHAADGLDRAVDAGRAGAAQAGSHWSGDASGALQRAWREHEAATLDDAAGCRALAAALDRYADAVTDAKGRVEELAVEAGATIVAGVALAWLTVGTSAAAAAGVSAALVAAAEAIGVELSATAASIVGGTLTGAAFGAGEAAVVDMAVTQPVRVEAFGDGGYSGTEVAGAAAAGGLFGGALGGFAARPAAAPPFPLAPPSPLGDLVPTAFPVARPVAPDLSEIDGRITAALDPSQRGALGPLFRAGIHQPAFVRFAPEQWPSARLLATGGGSVHASPVPGADPGALVRVSPTDIGRFTELGRPETPTVDGVENAILEAGGRLARNGHGDLVLDGRGVGLPVDVAGEGLANAAARATEHGLPFPQSIRFVFDEGSIWFP